MIRKSSDRHIEKRLAMRGGKGTVLVEHLFLQNEIRAKCRLCSVLKLEPLSSIGLHKHEGEDELFLVLRGSAVLIDEKGTKTFLSEGDAVLTGNGEAHSLVNENSQNVAEVLAVIMQYQ